MRVSVSRAATAADAGRAVAAVAAARDGVRPARSHAGRGARQGPKDAAAGTSGPGVTVPQV
ncbi:hypothetical protein GCM10027261_37490 [Geodermatophilus arenarius]